MLLLFFFTYFTVLTVAENTAYPKIPDCSLSESEEIVRPVRREVYGNGRIFDITHRYTNQMPAFDREGGMGQFLWLMAGMKNGSVCNISEMKLSMHAGTQVDAPGHVFDHYFDAGFDVDSLDLEVMNGTGHARYGLICFN